MLVTFRYLGCTLAALGLTACASMQAASDPWDQPKPNSIKMAQQAAQAPKPKQTPQKTAAAPAPRKMTTKARQTPVEQKQTLPVRSQTPPTRVASKPEQGAKPKPPAPRFTKQWLVSAPALPGQETTLTELSPNIQEVSVKPQDQPPPSLLELSTPPYASAFSNDSVVALAAQFLGTPYRFGGETPEEGFDCSGLVQYVFAQKGLMLPRLANEQALQGQPVAQSDLLPGDIVFFSISGSVVDHIGIYAGDNQFIHAPRTGKNITYEKLDSTYFTKRYQGARRLL